MKHFIFFIFVFFSLSRIAKAQTNQVLVIKFHKDVDASSARYAIKGLEEGEKDGYDQILIDLDTYGGGVKDADDIRKAILDYDKPISVFINPNAGSAGALISIACDSIFMSEGAIIGASSVVNGSGELVPEKYQSFMRSKMRATAEATGRNPQIAESMVGNNLNSVDSAHVTSLTTKEALKVGYCDRVVTSYEEIYEFEDKNTFTTFELGAIERLIAVFLNPYLKSILLLVILGGLYFELQTPGIGFPIIASALALLLFFIPNYIYGFVEHWEILLFIGGLILLVLEVFVIPGFGIAGISGISLIFLSLFLALIKNQGFDFSPVESQDLIDAYGVLVVGVVSSALFVLIGGAAFIKTKAFKRFTVTNKIDERTVNDKNLKMLIGKQGLAITKLSPSGKIKIGDITYDAISNSGYIDKNSNVIVTKKEMNALQVELYNIES